MMSADATVIKPPTSFTEDEQHVARNAQNFFAAGQYDATLGILKKLQKSHSNDVRLMLNRALTEFFKSGKTKVLDFKRSLVKIQKLLQQSNKEDEDIALATEKNHYVSLFYNQALLFYNLHQHSDAVTILEHLYESLDGSEETFLLRIGLLLIDNYIITYDAERAGNLIATIEKTFLSSEDTSRRSGTNNDEKVKNTSILSSHDAESLKIHLRYLKTLCYLQLKSIKSFKREIKTITNVSSNTSSGPQSNVVHITSVFLKSNFEYVRCNYHKAYKLLGGSPPPALSSNSVSNGIQDSLSSMYYNNLAVIYFGMGKYNLGSFYMHKALQENDAAVVMATKQHQLNHGTGNGRHQQQSNVKPLNVLNMNRRFELLHNCGIQLLYSGNAALAFEFLLAAVPAFHGNPRLWLRLAECCIQKCTACGSDKSKTGNSGKKFQQQNHATFAMIGSGIHRKVAINSIVQSIGGKGNNICSPSPTLEFASICLNNALLILQEALNDVDWDILFDSKKSNGGKVEEPNTKEPQIACFPGAPLSGDGVIHLYASVLVNSAFISLSLGNGLLALEFSEKLLTLPKLSGCHRYLGNMYAAEALVSLDRISEAISYLSIEKIKNVAVELDNNGRKSPASDNGNIKSGLNNNEHHHRIFLQLSGENISPWHLPTNTNCAHGYMILNLANAHCLRSEHEKAQRLLRQASSLVSAKLVPAQAILLAVYLHLQSGGNGITTALTLLRHNCLVVPNQANFLTHLQLSKENNMRNISPTANNISSSNMTGTGGDVSNTSSSGASRSKPSTPQPGSGGIASDRVGKNKNSEGKKKNRR